MKMDSEHLTLLDFFSLLEVPSGGSISWQTQISVKLKDRRFRKYNN